MLEISQYPELVVKLLFAKERPLTKSVIDPDEVLKPYPEQAQQAGKLLLFYPDVLEVMQEHLMATSVLGEVYKNDKQKIKQIVNQIAKEVEVEHNSAVDAWVERLQDNPEATEQLIAAYEAYAGQAAKPEQLAELTNLELAEDGGVEVSDLPSSDFTTYILNNSDQYPNLSDEFLGYYDSYYYDDYYRYGGYYYPPYATHYYPVYPGRGEIGDSIKDWVKDRPQVEPYDRRQNRADRVERLREQGRFDKDFAQARRNRSDLDRGKFLRENADRYPNLARNVERRRDKPQAAKRRSRYDRPRTRQHSRSTTAQRTSQRSRVRRRPSTQRQQVSRARRQHNRSWNRPSGGGQPRRPQGRGRPRR